MSPSRSKDHAGAVGRLDGAAVFTEAELSSLLDRSDLHWGKMTAAQAPTMEAEDKDLVLADKKRRSAAGNKRGRKKKGEEVEAKPAGSSLFKVIDMEEGSTTLLKSVKQEE